MSELLDLPVEPRTRDSLAVLAYIYLQFDRTDDAATLLAALARIDRDPMWARTTRCLALVMEGRNEEAQREAEELLRGTMEDTRRCHLLRILARACWNQGKAEEAREHQKAVRELMAVTVLRDREVSRR
jgi:predicted Zn-dependent protease